MDADVSNSTNVTITYVAGYGTSPVKQTITTYDASGMVTVQQTFLSSNLPTLTYPYGTFAGWFTTETFDSDTKANVGDDIRDTFGIVATGDYSVTLYAKWEPTERHLVSAMDVYALAEAVRAKAGTTAGILPQDIPAAIRALAGGGEPVTFTAYFPNDPIYYIGKVNSSDETETSPSFEILYEYSFDSATSATVSCNAGDILYINGCFVDSEFLGIYPIDGLDNYELLNIVNGSSSTVWKWWLRINGDTHIHFSMDGGTYV